jgi:hypothetical protein
LIDRTEECHVQITVGQSLASAVDTTTVIVVRAPGGPVELTCGDAEMIDAKSLAAVGERANPVAPGEGTQLGKRYHDVADTLEVLCTKSGSGSLAVDGTPMLLKSAKPLPASD